MITYEVTVDEYVTSWYRDGKLHREDGPAVERPDGYKAWYREDKRHRVDGPAVEYTDGYKAWWLDGKELTETEHACAGRTVTLDGVEYTLVLK